MFKILTVLVSTISNSQVFLLKNVSSSCKCKIYSHFFNKNISIYAIFNDQSFNYTLTNHIISFEQLGPDETGSLAMDRAQDQSDSMEVQADLRVLWGHMFKATFPNTLSYFC